MITDRSKLATLLSIALALASLPVAADTLDFTATVTSSTDPTVGTSIFGELTIDPGYYFLGGGVHEGVGEIAFMNATQFSLTSNGTLIFGETFPGSTPPTQTPSTSTLTTRMCGITPTFCPGYQAYSFNGSVADLTLNFQGDNVSNDLSFNPQQLTLANFTSATFDLTYLNNTVLGTITSDTFTPSPVPLPASVWLMLSGIVGLGAVMRGRRTARPLLT